MTTQILELARRWHGARKAVLECSQADAGKSDVFRAALGDLANAESALFKALDGAKPVLFRPHRGGLAEAMAEVKEVTSKAELLAIAQADLVEFFDVTDILIEPYGDDGKPCWDDRIGWNTYVVSIPGYGVYGFTNGPLS